MKKFMLRAIPVVFVVLALVSTTVSVMAVSNDTLYNPSGSIGSVDKAVGRIWGTVLTILQIAAVGALVYAGVKYMFASPDGKADIKQGMLGLVVGAILVFGASTVVKVIMSATNDVSNGIQ